MIARCACGAVWQQRGNQSGHCVGCHETFSSNKAFELHRRVDHCIHPSKVVDKNGQPLLVPRVDSLGVEQWGQRSRPVPAEWSKA